MRRLHGEGTKQGHTEQHITERDYLRRLKSYGYEQGEAFGKMSAYVPPWQWRTFKAVDPDGVQRYVQLRVTFGRWHLRKLSRLETIRVVTITQKKDLEKEFGARERHDRWRKQAEL